MDANTYINDNNNAILGYNKNVTPKYRYNDFGFAVGGPVYIPHVYNGKDKTFFFVSENWLREITYTSGSTAVNLYLPLLRSRATSATSGTSTATRLPRRTRNTFRVPVNVCTAYTNNPANQTNTCTAAGTNVAGKISPTAKAYLKDVYSKIPQNSLAQQQAYAANGIDPHSLYATLRNSGLRTSIR